MYKHVYIYIYIERERSVFIYVYGGCQPIQNNIDMRRTFTIHTKHDNNDDDAHDNNDTIT